MPQEPTTASNELPSGGTVARTARPTAASLAACASDEAPLGQPSATCARASMVQQRSPSPSPSRSGRPPALPRMRRRPASSADHAACGDAARSMRSRRSWSLMAKCGRPASSRARPPESGSSTPGAS
eukprot:8360574-Alexandrium_andersonii.AAC.1